jgi:TerD domain-containing protein
VPLDGVQHMRLLLQVSDDRDVEIDPIAFLLGKDGVVRADSDMVFYGQPDHASGAVTLAADDTGAPTTLHVTPAHVPCDVTEILLIAHLPASHPHPPVLDALDLDTGRAIGLLRLPTPGPTGLLQLGALHRADHGWELQPNQPSSSTTSPDSPPPPALTSDRGRHHTHTQGPVTSPPAPGRPSAGSATRMAGRAEGLRLIAAIGLSIAAARSAEAGAGGARYQRYSRRRADRFALPFAGGPMPMSLVS